MGSLKITIRSSATEERTVEVPIPSSRPLGGNTEVREFLAMRARERKAAARARRIKRTCLALGAATAVAAVVLPQWRARWRTAVAATEAAPATPAMATAAAPAEAGFAVTPARELELATATPTTEPEVAAAPATEVAATTEAAPAPEAAPATEPAPATEAAPAVPAETVTLGAVAPAKPASIHPGFRSEPPPADPDKCLEDFEQQRWRAAVENCTLAFETASEASLALKVAHAHWARGDVRLSGEWADRALELGSNDADAYVLIGHARRRAGQADEAIDAYRQYLRASPQGWHARKVRAALRRLRATAAAEAEAPPAPETDATTAPETTPAPETDPAAVPRAAADVEPAGQTLQ